eukprot:scaffold6963_cov110-Isochrysis_galbana.AAC.3
MRRARIDVHIHCRPRQHRQHCRCNPHRLPAMRSRAVPLSLGIRRRTRDLSARSARPHPPRARWRARSGRAAGTCIAQRCVVGPRRCLASSGGAVQTLPEWAHTDRAAGGAAEPRRARTSNGMRALRTWRMGPPAQWRAHPGSEARGRAAGAPPHTG